jgi:hypothetical protein
VDPSTDEVGWAEAAIDEACLSTQEWFRSLPQFEPRVNLRSVVGYRSPALLSERDCVIAFARFLVEAGVPWNAIHHEVSISRWIFDAPHPAATAMTTTAARRRIDLVLVKQQDLLAARLPAVAPGFAFEAFIEFGYLTDFWMEPQAQRFREPLAGREKVAADVRKIASHLEAGACRLGYVVAFEECDYGFEQDFATVAEVQSDCRVRFIRNF